MNFTSINLRGIIGLEKANWVKRIKREQKFSFLAVQETHQSGLLISDVIQFWDHSALAFQSVDAVGRSGGLFSVWDTDLFVVDSVVKNQNFLLVSGTLAEGDLRLNVMNVYAPNDPGSRRRLWEVILDVKADSNGLWVLMGDFNEVRTPDERVNSVFDSNAALVFNDFIGRGGLLEYGMSGGKFTYMSDNGQKLSKLDRVFVCEEFMNLWPAASFEVLNRGVSDHCPVVLRCSDCDFGPPPFKFFNSWIGAVRLDSIVAAAIEASVPSTSGVKSLVCLLKQIKTDIKAWRAVEKGLAELEVSKLSNAIRELELKAENQRLSTDECNLRVNLRSRLKSLEVAKARDIKQKARMNWIRLGDENSTFFHRCVSFNLAKNRINRLLINGDWCSDPTLLKEELKQWFKKLFGEPMRRRPGYVNDGLPSLSVVHADALIAPFSVSEVKKAVFECESGKTPGPDGFTLKFFKHFWSSLHPAIMKMMTDFFDTGSFNVGCNASFIALIPKIKDPQVINDYRPISLVGSVYKIVAKVLANRLKPVMDTLISPTQAAFVGGRNIIDNPLIISELILWAKKSKQKMLIFKVDFHKAYDSLNWKFLLTTLGNMGFPNRWVEWIKGCLSSGTGSVLVNGSPTGEFSFKRGLRQGDPMSPFLFIIAMEVLVMFINRAVNRGMFHGFRCPNNGPCISHLCYADDVLFVGEWSEFNVRSLARFLRCLYLVTGLKVNLEKCNLFGIGVEEDEVSRMANILNCRIGLLPFNYLGIPIGANMKRVAHWKPVIDKFHSRLSSWKAKTLSFAGRVTLAKAVLGSLPSYFLSIFKAPVSVLKKLESIRRDFIWGKTGSRGKIRWVGWNKFIKPKALGGIGVGSIKDFNTAMLAKWWWRIKDSPNHLWSSVIASIHHTRVASKLVPCKKAIPGVWKDISSIDVELLKDGVNVVEQLQVDVGDGYSTKFWSDCWIGPEPIKSLFPELYSIAKLKEGSVADHICFRGDAIFWGWPWLRDPNSNMEWDGKDNWVWKNDAGVKFSVKSLRFELAKARAAGAETEEFCWNNWAILKANYLAWRGCMGRVAAKQALLRRGVQITNPLCDRCGSAEESTDHVFVSCLFAKCIWWNVFRWIKVSWPNDLVSLREIFGHLKKEPGSKRWKKMVSMIALATVWRIWKARNAKVFDGVFISVSQSTELIKEDSFLWLTHRANGLNPYWESWTAFDVSSLV